MSQNNAKPADKRKGDPKSWVVVEINHKPELVQSTWQPGYTPMHKATAGEAIGAALVEARLQVDIAQQRVMDLTAMRYRIDPPESSGWTSHGHPMPGLPQVGQRPANVARCAGVSRCKVCTKESHIAIMAATNPITKR